jgi:hypothetical protein
VRTLNRPENSYSNTYQLHEVTAVVSNTTVPSDAILADDEIEAAVRDEHHSIPESVRDRVLD